jgi:hypothetical protein
VADDAVLVAEAGGREADLLVRECASMRRLLVLGVLGGVAGLAVGALLAVRMLMAADVSLDDRGVRPARPVSAVGEEREREEEGSGHREGTDGKNPHAIAL